MPQWCQAVSPAAARGCLERRTWLAFECRRTASAFLHLAARFWGPQRMAD